MAKQNIFDNEEFFNRYCDLRDDKVNANNLFEIPALFSLLPDLKGKRILDLGCGFGEHCKKFLELGASFVTGIDISERMLGVARKENSDPNIEYIQMPIEDIDALKDSYDLVVSSLAFHYVQDFGGVLSKINKLLNKGGMLVFSQEHPLTTSYTGEKRWTRDQYGNKIYLNLRNYSVEGEREITWFVDGVKNYHRTFSTIINTLIENGFTIEKMLEPVPTKQMIEKYPDLVDLFHKPDFVLIKAHKND